MTPVQYIKRSVIELPKYTVRQEIAGVKLNQNESPYDLPAGLRSEILGRLRKTDWNRYPSGQATELKKAISDYTGHPLGGIVVGNGSNDVIQAILLAACRRNDRLLAVSPGYPIYVYLARIMELQVVDVPLDDDFEFNVPLLLERARDVDIAFIASPNSPTGTTLAMEGIEELLKRTKFPVVIDEAYSEFHRESALRLLSEHANLLICRTFSKAFGLAGLRLGYLLCSREIAEHIEKARLPFSVGIFQQIAGTVVMKNSRMVEATIAEIILEREIMYSRLQAIPGIAPVPSAANFILFAVDGIPAKNVYEALCDKGVLVRYFDRPGLETMLRVTIGKPRENKVFISVLKKIMRDVGAKREKYEKRGS